MAKHRLCLLNMKVLPSRTLQKHRYLELVPSLRSFVASRVSKPDVIDDVVQETLARTYKSADFSTMIKPLAYLITVANSVLADYWRRDKSECGELPEQVTEPHQSLEAQYIVQEKLVAISEVLDAMPPLRRKVFILRRFKGLTRSEIASQLDLNEEAVKKHITRAMLDITLASEQQGWLDD